MGFQELPIHLEEFHSKEYKLNLEIYLEQLGSARDWILFKIIIVQIWYGSCFNVFSRVRLQRVWNQWKPFDAQMWNRRNSDVHKIFYNGDILKSLKIYNRKSFGMIWKYCEASGFQEFGTWKCKRLNYIWNHYFANKCLLSGTTF